MNITIFGTGNMAQGFASLFAGAGHGVTLASRELGNAERVAAEIGQGTVGAAYGDAAQNSDFVILAVPYDAANAVIEAAGGLAGKVVIDITNPMATDFSGLTIGHSTSAAEEIQNHAPEARVIKAFNTVFAQVLQAGGKAAGQPATVFVAGDDVEARRSVADLAASVGFQSLETGPLSTARYLEPVAALNITLGYGVGLGTDIAPTWQRGL